MLPSQQRHPVLTDCKLVQAAADVVCQQLGFDFGAFQNDFSRDRPSPPWVGQLECDGFEDMLNECGEFMFGNTQECEDSQLRLLCSSFGAGVAIHRHGTYSA